MHVCVFDCRTLMFSSGIAVTPNTTLIPCPTALFFDIIPDNSNVFAWDRVGKSMQFKILLSAMSNQVTKIYLRDLRNHNESYYLSKSFHSGLSEQSFWKRVCCQWFEWSGARTVSCTSRGMRRSGFLLALAAANRCWCKPTGMSS